MSAVLEVNLSKRDKEMNGSCKVVAVLLRKGRRFSCHFVGHDVAPTEGA